MEKRVLPPTDSKTSVLLFAGIMLAAYFGATMAQQFLRPEWVGTATMVTMMTYLTFAYVLRDNWVRATLATVVMLMLAVVLEYVRSHL